MRIHGYSWIFHICPLRQLAGYQYVSIKIHVWITFGRWQMTVSPMSVAVNIDHFCQGCLLARRAARVVDSGGVLPKGSKPRNWIQIQEPDICHGLGLVTHQKNPCDVLRWFEMRVLLPCFSTRWKHATMSLQRPTWHWEVYLQCGLTA